MKVKRKDMYLFNDILNTFYFRLYDVGHVVHGDAVRKETPCRDFVGYSFSLVSKGSFISNISQTGW